MAKIPTIGENQVPMSVPLQEGNGYRVRSDSTDRTGAIRGQMFGGLAALANAVAIKEQAMVNNTMTSNAVAQATQQMTNLFNESMNVKGENVIGKDATDNSPAVAPLYDRWQSGINKIHEQIRNGLQNDLQRRKFDESMNSLVPDLNVKMAKHQSDEILAAQEESRKARSDTTFGLVGISADGGDWGAMDAGLDMVAQNNADSYALAGTPKDAQMVSDQKQVYDWAINMSKKWQGEGRSAQIGALTEQLERKGRISSSQAESLRSMNADGLMTEEADKIAKDIVSKAMTPWGIDEQKANTLIENYAIQQNLQETKAHSATAFIDAITGQESGGNYDATNAISGAYGKYQVMPDKWAEIMQRNGLSMDTPMTPENQDKYVKAELKRLKDTYGIEGAAVAWYAGEANAKRWVEGKETAIDGNGNEYSWDAPQSGAPSVRQYVTDVNGRIDANLPTGSTMTDPVFKAKLEAGVKRYGAMADNQRVLRNNTSAALMRNWANGNKEAPLTAIMAYAAELAPDDPNAQAGLVQIATGTENVYRQEDSRMAAQEYDNALTYIPNHSNTSFDDLGMTFPHLNNQQKFSLLKAYGKNPDGTYSAENVKWLDAAASARLDAAVRARFKNNQTQRDYLKSNVILSMNEKVAQYVKQYGAAPTPAKIAAMIQASTNEADMESKSWISENYDSYTTAELPQELTQTGAKQAVDVYGNIWEFNDKNRMWSPKGKTDQYYER